MYTNIRQLVKRLGLVVVTAAVVMVGAMPRDADATHWRGGNIAWTPTANANEIEFTITTYWRTTFFFASPNTPNVGVDTFTPGTFNFGDASNSSLAGTLVTAKNVAGDWMEGTTVLTHTYNSAGPWTSSLNGCCRLSSLENNADGAYLIESVVTVDGSSNPNTNSTSPIFLLPLGGVQQFTPVVPVDPDGDVVSYALATGAQMGDAGHTQPTGMSINAMTGEITVDTSHPDYGPNQLWSTQIVVTDANGNTTATDFLYQTCSPGTPNCGGFVPPTGVPEPGTLMLMSLALLGIGGVARSRRRRNV